MQSIQAERRRSSRVPKRMAVKLHDLRTGHSADHWTADLSLDGIMLDGRVTRGPGTSVSISIGGSSRGRLDLSGVVLATSDQGATTRIRFEGLTTSSRVKLLEVLFG